MLDASVPPRGPARAPAADRRILLADADAFYVAVARLEDPDGAGRERLLLVGGSPKGRGVVTSASYETRAYGVRSGMPTAQALRLCPDAVSVPVSGAACQRKSREIRQVLERFTPMVEAASIDEFYLDLTGTEELYRGEPLAVTAAAIRRAVLDETGIPISIGGGTSKLIAKLAAKQAKPHRGGDGVSVVPPGDEPEFLAGLDLADLPGVGPRFQERLASLDLRTVTDALAHDREQLAAWLGPRAGGWLYRRLRGVDEAPVVAHARAKSMSREETFAVDLSADGDLDRELSRLAARLAADLRRKAWRARTVTVKLRDADFTTRQASRTAEHPIDSDRAIADLARALLRALRRTRRCPARLIGIQASNLVAASDRPYQLDLFGGREPPGHPAGEETLLRAVDDINRRFGRDRIARASAVTPRPKPR